MKLKITVNSVANDTEYGGKQIVEANKGEFVLDEIFKLPFFRIIIDEVISAEELDGENGGESGGYDGDGENGGGGEGLGALCFRLMEGAAAHYFVLDNKNTTAGFSRETSLGEDNFLFELLK